MFNIPNDKFVVCVLMFNILIVFVANVNILHAR